MTHRPTVYGTRHAVSAGHYLAAAAGFAILEAGGNAIDAGCAAGIALGVLQPDLVNFAGVAPIMIRLADGTMESIAGLGWWPKTLPADLFMREHGGKIPDGVLRTVVPAAPDAWITALRRHGTMRFADVAASGDPFRRRGVRGVSAAGTVDRLARSRNIAAGNPTPRCSCPAGRVPRAGREVRADRSGAHHAVHGRPGPRRRADRIAGLNAAHHAFYRGDIAREIVRFQQQEGGYLSMDDMAEYQFARSNRWCGGRWRGHELMTCGPWCQGPALQQALALVERSASTGWRTTRPTYLHRIVECLNLALADREYYFGDPRVHRCADGPSAGPRHDRPPGGRGARRPGVRADAGAARSAQPAVSRRARAELPKVEADTSYCCVVDRWGNAFSATPSDGSGNVPVVPGLGIAPSGRGSQSRPDPRHPAGVAPGKRPRLTPNPAMLVTDSRRRDAVRHAGRRRADPGNAAGTAERHAFRHGPAERDRGAAGGVLFFPLVVRAVRVFPRAAGDRGADRPGDTRRTGGARARVQDWPDWTWLAGSVEAILTDPETGMMGAGADPRRPAYAIAI